MNLRRVREITRLTVQEQRAVIVLLLAIVALVWMKYSSDARRESAAANPPTVNPSAELHPSDSPGIRP